MNKSKLKVGILHPGEMGSFVAAGLVATLGQAYWCSEGRGENTRARAAKLGLSEVTTLDVLCTTCDALISVCPPHAAEAQSEAVIRAGFAGLYLEANAISPAAVKQIAERMETAGISVVDGGIVGLPTYKAGTTWLYLSGAKAEAFLPCFANADLETSILGTDIGQASAMKMCFAAWNKGKNALLTSILAAAEKMGVREALEAQWDIFDPGFSEQSTTRIRNVARKAWRFGPEMEEIALTLQSCNVPHESFLAAAELYRRESAFKDTSEPPSLEEILSAVSKTPK